MVEFMATDARDSVDKNVVLARDVRCGWASTIDDDLWPLLSVFVEGGNGHHDHHGRETYCPPCLFQVEGVMRVTCLHSVKDANKKGQSRCFTVWTGWFRVDGYRVKRVATSLIETQKGTSAWCVNLGSVDRRMGLEMSKSKMKMFCHIRG